MSLGTFQNILILEKDDKDYTDDDHGLYISIVTWLRSKMAKHQFNNLYLFIVTNKFSLHTSSTVNSSKTEQNSPSL